MHIAVFTTFAATRKEPLTDELARIYPAVLVSAPDGPSREAGGQGSCSRRPRFQRNLRYFPMTAYVALLRAVNQGGRGHLKMEDLQALCEARGLGNVRIHGQGGNIVFESDRTERALCQDLDRAVGDKLRRPTGVLIRTAAEMRAILEANPFPDARFRLVGVMFLPKVLPVRLLTELALGGPEDVRMIGREIFVHYPDGIERSKMKIPFAADGTTRDLTTISKLVAMAEG
jgi:uncharacterized protein (DUF1697 family)